MIVLELPWPPSVNHYYRHVGPRVLISKDGRKYRDIVSKRIQGANIPQRKDEVELSIQLYPPDNRRRDVDNVLKCLLDTLTAAGLYEDDSQIKFLAMEKLESMPPNGMVVLFVEHYRKSFSEKFWSFITKNFKLGAKNEKSSSSEG